MRTRAAVLIAAALTLTGLPSLQSGQAADPPGSTPVAIVSANGQLLEQASPHGPRIPFGEAGSKPPGPTRPIFALAVSRDGTRVVTTEEPLSPPDVIVRDVGGTVVYDQTDFSDDLLYNPQLSPDGTLLAYGDRDLDSDPFRGEPGIDVRSLGRGSGTHIRLAGPAQLSEHVFLTQDLLLVKDATAPTALARFRAIDVRDGATGRAVTGLTDTATTDVKDFALNPSGTRMAYVRTSGTTSAVEVVSVTVSGTQVAFGQRRVLATGSVGAPAFSRDGGTVVFTSGAVSKRDLFSVPAHGGPVVRWGPATPLVDEEAVVFATKETTAPGAVQLGKAILGDGRPDASLVQLPVQVPADPTLSRLHVIRTASGEDPYESDTLLPTTSIRSGGLVLGRTYTYVVQPFDRSGNAGPVATLQLVATKPPSMTAADPTSLTSTSSGYEVQLSAAGNAADTRYTVDSRVQGRTTWERLSTLTTAPSVQAAGAPGQTYAFRGAAVDRFGNLTVPTPGFRAVVPFDQLQRAIYAGAVSTAAREGAYGGTVTFLRATGSTVTLRSAGDRLQLVGERCPACGEVDVFLDGKRQARVDTGAPVRAVRQVLWSSPVQFTNRVRTMTARAVGTVGRPGVVVDALSARRYGPDGGNLLLTGQQLRIGDQLTATNGYYGSEFDGRLRLGATSRSTPAGDRLVMQTDGNLVIYAGARAVWSSRTEGNPSSSLVQQPNGELIVYRGSDGRPIWTAVKGRLY